MSPVLGHTPPEEKLSEGEELRLSCIAVLGTPKPTLKWYKDGKPIQSSAYVTVSFSLLKSKSIKSAQAYLNWLVTFSELLFLYPISHFFFQILSISIF